MLEYGARDYRYVVSREFARRRAAGLPLCFGVETDPVTRLSKIVPASRRTELEARASQQRRERSQRDRERRFDALRRELERDARGNHRERYEALKREHNLP